MTVTGRDPRHLATPDARFVRANRDDAAALSTVGGCDLLVDCICYTAAQARLLLPLVRDAGSTVMISSKAVYVDDAGNHSNSPTPPRFPGPVTEQQPTMKPGDMPYNSPDGYGANKVAAEHVFLDSGEPVTVLRPSKIHGEGASPSREWYFVKRALDRRPAVLLARRGTGVDHPTAAVNIAALVQVAAERPGRRILNAADPDAPDGLTISRVIAGLAGHAWREVLLDEDAPADLGRHPWHRWPPVVLDTSAAQALGYRPVGDYATTVAASVAWLMGQTTVHVDHWFNYIAEDAWLSAHRS